MASVEERMKILKMIEEGKLSAEEGTKLLAALSERRGPPARMPGMPGPARWLRIRVTDTRSGRSKASVQIPLALVDAGLKIGAQLWDRVNPQFPFMITAIVLLLSVIPIWIKFKLPKTVENESVPSEEQAAVTTA